MVAGKTKDTYSVAVNPTQKTTKLLTHDFSGRDLKCWDALTAMMLQKNH